MTGSVAKVYSEAIFELAVEQNCAESVFNELESLKSIWSDNSEFVKILNAPTISIDEKLGMVKEIFNGRTSDIVYNFLCVITEKSRWYYLPEIADAYKERWYDLSGLAEVSVTTTVPLSAELREKLVKKLEAVYEKKVLLNEKTDSSLIGGMVINYGNTMLDGSIRTKLDTIKKQINGTIA